MDAYKYASCSYIVDGYKYASCSYIVDAYKYASRSYIVDAYKYASRTVGNRTRYVAIFILQVAVECSPPPKTVGRVNLRYKIAYFDVFFFLTNLH